MSALDRPSASFFIVIKECLWLTCNCSLLDLPTFCNLGNHTVHEDVGQEDFEVNQNEGQAISLFQQKDLPNLATGRQYKYKG